MKKAKKILLVENEFYTRYLFTLVLEDAGFSVKAVSDGIEALNVIEKTLADNSTFDFLITDLQMPYMNGIELIRKLQERSIRIPSILVSSYNKKEVEAIAYSDFSYLNSQLKLSGCLGVIEKPSFPDELIKMLDTVKVV